MEKFNLKKYLDNNNLFKPTTVDFVREFLKLEKKRNNKYMQCSVKEWHYDFLIEPGVIYNRALDPENPTKKEYYWIVYKSEDIIQCYKIDNPDYVPKKKSSNLSFKPYNQTVPAAPSNGNHSSPVPTLAPHYSQNIAKKLKYAFQKYSEAWTYWLDDGYRQAKIIKSLKKPPLKNEENFIQQFQEKFSGDSMDVDTETLHRDLLALQEQKLLIIDENGCISLSANCDKLMENNKYIYLI